MIQRGEADVVLAGGSDAMVNPLGVLGFGMLGTLSRRNEDPSAASRPFDCDRDGFVIGEGAAVIVLEREGHARSRSAPVLAELAGYASTCDAWRLTDERPDAAGASAAIRRCLEDAGAAADDVDYVNAHGTGTRMNDTTEAAAIRQVFGARTDHLPVSSTKSMIGHLLAGAGAVELAASLLALRGGFVPPTINCTHPDPDCPIDPVPLHAREVPIQTVLSNSFGFGGQNACLLIRRA
jgi:3-oxoacyl-[acyl-carrier-protein] synthase II